MSKEFNYERAWKELYAPALHQMPLQIRSLVNEFAYLAPKLVQNRHHLEQLDLTEEAQGIKANFDHLFKTWEEFKKVAGRSGAELADAAELVYWYGHLAPGNASKDGHFDAQRDGLYWKFKSLVIAALIEAKTSGEIMHRAKAKYDALNNTFYDHKEGTELDNDEIAEKYRPLVEDVFEVVGVRDVNFKPDIFCIGTRHFPKDGGMYIRPEQAPCCNCGKPYAEHTHDRVMFLKCLRDLPNREAAKALNRIKKAAEKDKVRLDGFGFVENGFKIEPPKEKTPVG